MSEDTKKKILRKPSKRTLIVTGAVIAAAAVVWAVLSTGVLGGSLGAKKVSF